MAQSKQLSLPPSFNIGVELHRSEILDRAQSIIRGLIGDQTIAITDRMIVDDIPDWDSVTHVQIVVAIEKHFGIFFDPEEYMEFADLGEMIDCVAAKLARRSNPDSLGLPANN